MKHIGHKPKASNHAVAKMLGVDHRTVDRDAGENAPPSDQNPQQDQSSAGANSPAPSLGGAEAARVVERAETPDPIVLAVMAALSDLGLVDLAQHAVIKRLVLLFSEHDVAIRRLLAKADPSRKPPLGWLNLKTAAAILGCTTENVRQRCAHGKFIGADQFPVQWFIPPEAVQADLESKCITKAASGPTVRQ